MARFFRRRKFCRFTAEGIEQIREQLPGQRVVPDDPGDVMEERIGGALELRPVAL